MLSNPTISRCKGCDRASFTVSTNLAHCCRLGVSTLSYAVWQVPTMEGVQQTQQNQNCWQTCQMASLHAEVPSGRSKPGRRLIDIGISRKGFQVLRVTLMRGSVQKWFVLPWLLDFPNDHSLDWWRPSVIYWGDLVARRYWQLVSLCQWSTILKHLSYGTQSNYSWKGIVLGEAIWISIIIGHSIRWPLLVIIP